MKNTCLTVLSWALVTTTALSLIHVSAFQWNALSTVRAPVIATRLPQERCQYSRSSFSSTTPENTISSILPTAIVEKVSVTDTRTYQDTWKMAGRSILASSLALALATGSFAEMANAEGVTTAPDIVQIIDTASTESSGGSQAGNAVVYAWVGISAFAGVKGISDRIQQEQQEEQ